MPSTYRFLAEFAQSWGLVYFFGVFLVVVIYALWPSNKDKFEEASRMPLRED